MGVRIRQQDGKWYVCITHQGTRKAKCGGTDKRLAVQVQQPLEAKLTLGDVGLRTEEPQRLLLRDYAQQWLTPYAVRALKPSSPRVARSMSTNHLAPACGPVPMRELSRQQVTACVASQTTLAPPHVSNLMRSLSGICIQAVRARVRTWSIVSIRRRNHLQPHCNLSATLSSNLL